MPTQDEFVRGPQSAGPAVVDPARTAGSAITVATASSRSTRTRFVTASGPAGRRSAEAEAARRLLGMPLLDDEDSFGAAQ
jgi:hypothetical protein